MHKTVTVFFPSLGLISMFQTLQAYFSTVLLFFIFVLRLFKWFQCVAVTFSFNMPLSCSLDRLFILCHLVTILKFSIHDHKSFIIYIYLSSSAWYEFQIDFCFSLNSSVLSEGRTERTQFSRWMWSKNEIVFRIFVFMHMNCFHFFSHGKCVMWSALSTQTS